MPWEVVQGAVRSVDFTLSVKSAKIGAEMPVTVAAGKPGADVLSVFFAHARDGGDPDGKGGESAALMGSASAATEDVSPTDKLLLMDHCDGPHKKASGKNITYRFFEEAVLTGHNLTVIGRVDGAVDPSVKAPKSSQVAPAAAAVANADAGAAKPSGEGESKPEGPGEDGDKLVVPTLDVTLVPIPASAPLRSKWFVKWCIFPFAPISLSGLLLWHEGDKNTTYERDTEHGLELVPLPPKHDAEAAATAGINERTSRRTAAAGCMNACRGCCRGTLTVSEYSVGLLLCAAVPITLAWLIIDAATCKTANSRKTCTVPPPLSLLWLLLVVLYVLVWRCAYRRHYEQQRDELLESVVKDPADARPGDIVSFTGSVHHIPDRPQLVAPLSKASPAVYHNSYFMRNKAAEKALEAQKKRQEKEAQAARKAAGETETPS